MPPASGAPAKEQYALSPARGISLRHIRLGTAASPGAKKVLGVYYYPDAKGLNGLFGFQSGNYEKRMNEEGQFSITLSNNVGQDGTLHRDRFALIADDTYRPGDEFIEIWQGRELLFVGVPVSYQLSLTQVQITGFSPFWLLKKTRETAAGYWVSAPRDALEHYLSLWQTAISDDFVEWPNAFSESTLNTADKRWQYRAVQANAAGSAILLGGGVGVDSVIGRSNSAPSNPLNSSFTRAWRAECSYNMVSKGKEATILFEVAGGVWQTWINFDPVNNKLTINSGAEKAESINVNTTALSSFYLAIERRDRWLYFYLNGKLLTVQPSKTTQETTISTFRLLASNESLIEVNMMLLRTLQPWLRNSAAPGDYSLPGAPPAGALEGHYNSDQDIWASTLPTELKLGKVLHPIRETDPGVGASGGLYQRRKDQTINFPPGVGAPTWQPSGPPNGEKFSVRWVGSVYLDLTNYDFAFRLAKVDDRARIWIGKTRLDEALIEDWTVAGHGETTTTGTWVKAGSAAGIPPTGTAGPMAGFTAGWYPILIEYSQGTGPGGLVVEYERSDTPGTWQVLGKPVSSTEGGNYSAPVVSLLKLSPLGLYQATVLWDSHYDAFQSIVESFGYQWTETPASLESNLFPGYVEPKARVGRDTDYVLDKVEGTEASVVGNADDVADALLGEAQGLGDPSQQNNLMAEVFNFPLEPGLLVNQEQESVSDINQEALLLQRLRSLLALRSSPWEEAGAQPKGTPRLTDTFPLSGKLAEFKWTPGDGLRLQFPEVKIEDQSPRQIMGINQPFNRDNLLVPTVSFRQRPRNFIATLRKMITNSIAQKRNYQGQIVAVMGSIGGSGGVGGGYVDSFSRVGLPINIGDVFAATLVVLLKSDASEKEILVNGAATGQKLTTVGRYNILAWIARSGSVSPYLFAQTTGGSGEITYQIELMVHV